LHIFAQIHHKPFSMGFINLDQHRNLEKEGFLFINSHEHLPLLIHNYAQKAQYDRHWVPETLTSRGLITDLEGRIIARPFGKFFNLDEHIELFGPLPDEPFEVYEKMDGSLGILYFHEGRPLVATRGSFHSSQSERANEILRKKYGHIQFDPAITYLFEIIFPENRIVVDYSGLEDLILLAMTETATGKEIPLSEAPDVPLVRRYDGFRDLEALRAIQEDNKEGFVIRFKSGLRVKLKFDEYVRLHKIMTGITARMIWEQISAGQDLGSFLENVPDEFYKWIKMVEGELRTDFKKIEDEAKGEFRHFDNRKAAAAHYLGECKYPMILFRMLDGRSYDEIIWKMVRPEHRTAFKMDTEA
jgi:RNA ligase